MDEAGGSVDAHCVHCVVGTRVYGLIPVLSSKPASMGMLRTFVGSSLSTHWMLQGWWCGGGGGAGRGCVKRARKGRVEVPGCAATAESRRATPPAPDPPCASAA